MGSFILIFFRTYYRKMLSNMEISNERDYIRKNLIIYTFIILMTMIQYIRFGYIILIPSNILMCHYEYNSNDYYNNYNF